METTGTRIPLGIGTDPEVFEAFYRDHLDTVRQFVARRVADPELAADLTAAVFLAAMDRASSYRPDRGSPAAWLIGVARNVVADEFRNQFRQQRLQRRVAGQRVLDADSMERIEERIDAQRETRRLYAALATLKERDRALLELVAVDGLSVADAAAVLGLKPGAARVRLHRSRRALQAQFELFRTPAFVEVVS